jgi:tubulin polyglutamylase complex subunit 2
MEAQFQRKNAATSELADLCESVVAYLEEVEGVRNVLLSARSGVGPGAMQVWERTHYPAQLPTALKAFLHHSDGLSLTWSIDHMGEELPLGCMHLNALKQLVRVDIDPSEVRHATAPRDGAAARRASHLASRADGPEDAQELMAFDLDATAHDGRLCLLYRPPAMESPEVWFQDLSRSWYCVAESFADYLRLLLMHLGLPRWQYAYTDVGLDPVARQWIRLLAPHRLQAHAEKGQADTGARSRPFAHDAVGRELAAPRWVPTPHAAGETGARAAGDAGVRAAGDAGARAAGDAGVRALAAQARAAARRLAPPLAASSSSARAHGRRRPSGGGATTFPPLTDRGADAGASEVDGGLAVAAAGRPNSASSARDGWGS